MKKNYVIIMIYVLISCNNAADKNIVNDDHLNISVLKSENMSIGDELCYYATMNGDTLNMFCDLYVKPQWNIMNIQFRCIDYEISLSDSTILGASNDGIYKKTAYNQQMFLIVEYIRRIADDADIQKLTGIEFPLLTSGTLNVEISIMLVNHKTDITKAVMNSSLFANMNNILKKYKLKITDVAIEKYVLVDKQSFMNSNLADSIPPLGTNDKFVCCNVYFEISPV